MNIRNRLTKLEVKAGPDPREVERERRRAARRARVVRCESVLRMVGEDTDMPPSALIGLQTVVDGDYSRHKGCHHPLAVFVAGELHDGRTDPFPQPLVAALLTPSAEFWGHCPRPEDGPYYADRLPPPWLDLHHRGCRACRRKLPASVVYHGERVEFPFPSCPWCSSTDLGCLSHGCRCRDCDRREFGHSVELDYSTRRRCPA